LTTYGCTVMTANKLHVLVYHFVSVCLFTASVDHFQVRDTILRSIKVTIMCRSEWILTTYCKAMLLFTVHMNIFNSVYDTDLEGNEAL
jgi:hypothetical protein